MCRAARSLSYLSFILCLAQHKSRGRHPSVRTNTNKTMKSEPGESGSFTLLMQTFFWKHFFCSPGMSVLFCLFIASTFHTRSLKQRVWKERWGNNPLVRIAMFHPVGFRSVSCAEAKLKCSDFWIISPGYSHNGLLSAYWCWLWWCQSKELKAALVGCRVEGAGEPAFGMT